MDDGFTSLMSPAPQGETLSASQQRKRHKGKRDRTKKDADEPAPPAEIQDEELMPVNPLSSAARSRAKWAPPGGEVPMPQPQAHDEQHTLAYANDAADDGANDGIPLLGRDSLGESAMIPFSQLTVTAPTPSQSTDQHPVNGTATPPSAGMSAELLPNVSNTSKGSQNSGDASGLTIAIPAEGQEAHPDVAPRRVPTQAPLPRRAPSGEAISELEVTAGPGGAGSAGVESKPADTANAATADPGSAPDDSEGGGGGGGGGKARLEEVASLPSHEASCFAPPINRERISQCFQRFTNVHDLIEVHTLKRAMHFSKIQPTQKIFVLPTRYNHEKMVPVKACLRSMQRLLQSAPSVAEELVAKLSSVPDAFIGIEASPVAAAGDKGAAASKGSQGSASGGSKPGALHSMVLSIEGRLRQIISDTRASLADNEVRRLWDTLHLITIFVFYSISAVQNVMLLEFDYEGRPGNNSWRFITFMVCHAFWILDLILTTQMFAIDSDGRLVKKFSEVVAARKYVILIDIIGLLPIDFALQASGHFIPFLVFRIAKYIKLARAGSLYEIVNRDIITPSTVTFFFQYKPIVLGLYWLSAFIHACAVAHNLIDQYEIRPRRFPGYGYSLVAVCIMLSGSNANVDVWATADKLLCIPLAILSLFGQGVLVGKLTALVFRNSVSAENYQLMRDTLGIVRHYKVPNSIQREVLSYQMHALNDDVARHMRNLETLPQQMQQEIMLYIKIDAVSKVKMFATATDRCKMLLASSLKRVVVEPEVEVVRFGEPGDQMYMVAHGYADVILGTGKIVTTFTRGDCFGEMALVQKSSTRTATVRALTYCDMWTLDKKSFLHALAQSPEFQEGVEEELRKRNANIDELREAVSAVQATLLGAHDDSQTEESSSPTMARTDLEDVQDVDVNLQRGLLRRESALISAQRHNSLKGSFGAPSGNRASVLGGAPMLQHRQSTRLSLYGDGTVEATSSGGGGGGGGAPALQRGGSNSGLLPRAGSTLSRGTAELRQKLAARSATEMESFERDIGKIKRLLQETKKRSVEMQQHLETSAPRLNLTKGPLTADSTPPRSPADKSLGKQ